MEKVKVFDKFSYIMCIFSFDNIYVIYTSGSGFRSYEFLQCR